MQSDSKVFKLDLLCDAIEYGEELIEDVCKINEEVHNKVLFPEAYKLTFSGELCILLQSDLDEGFAVYEQELEEAPETLKQEWKESNAGINRKKGSGRRADAQIVAMFAKGASVEEVIKTRFVYNREGHKKYYSRGKIFAASSVKKPEDYQRIMDLYEDFPDIFGGISKERLIGWIQKKASKGGNSNGSNL